ncbi:MAG: helix-turn-helix transcriptional regulator [Bacteroidia bacterium]
MKSKIGERIRRLRALKGLKQADVADEIGITSGAYAKIERGESDPNTERLLGIAKALKIPISDLFEDKVAAKDYPNSYGYATKDEVEGLAKVVHTLTAEVKKLREELLQVKPTTKRAVKKSKKVN